MADKFDEVGITSKEYENMIITVRTQLLHEGENIVIHITRKIINKLTGKTSTETVYREVVESTYQ
jgi:hypothetical protein